MAWALTKRRGFVPAAPTPGRPGAATRALTLPSPAGSAMPTPAPAPPHQTTRARSGRPTLGPRSLDQSIARCPDCRPAIILSGYSCSLRVLGHLRARPLNRRLPDSRRGVLEIITTYGTRPLVIPDIHQGLVPDGAHC